jgi:hypothetical protein
MSELDQAAFDAVVNAMSMYHDPDGMEHTPPPEYWPGMASAAITAYQTAMAPQVREAVGKVVACAERFAGTEAVNFGTHEELEETERDLIDAKRTLLELLGAQEETE